MPLTEEAKRKKREREKANSQSIAKAINNKTVKAATDTTKAVSNIKGQPSLSKPKQDTLDRLNQKYGGGAKQDTVQKYTNKPANRRTNTQQRTEPAVSRNPRMLDTAQNVTPKQTTSQEREQRRTEAQRQKSGFNSMASEKAQRSARRALRNTPGVAKEALKQVGIGHGKTASDITAWNKSVAIGSKLDIKPSRFQEDIEKRRTASTKAAENAYKELSSAQERSEQRMQKMTKNVKGLEKAYYGALESGVGMISDQLLGPAWAASMLSRTYGNTRGQAQKEGATEAEDRAYALLQGAKEVATEYAFRGIGLSSRLSGKMSLSPSEVLANAATRNMRGTAADLTHAGIRLLGGTAEENAEEVLGWAADPLISEFTYKKNVRSREAQEQLKKQSDSLRSKIGNEADARAMAAYLGSNDFIETNKKTYMDSGISEAEATDLAMQMRDYLTASLSGDTKAMTDIEDKLSKKLAGKGLSAKSWSMSELMDTIASTTLLTMTTGLPGAAISSSQGAAFLQNNSSDAIRALANTAIDFEDKEMSMKAQAMRDRLDSGKEITSTQAYDLMHGAQEQYAKDSGRQLAAYQTADKTIKSDNLIAPRVMRGRDGAVTGDEIASETFAETANTAERNIRALVNKKDSAESLTDDEIDRGAQAVAGFKTGTFTIDDANELNYRNTAVRAAFEAETGIDLKQFIVTKSNGEVDIPATNAATKNALFAMAADNYVQTAKAETANWMDNTKGQVVSQISQRMGAKGTKALQESLDGVDERNRSEYMMTANATDMLYQAARNMGTEWDNVKADAVKLFPQISEQKLKTMYDAGLEDRAMAMDDARGQQIQIGEKVKLAKDNSNAPTGNLLIETSAPVKGTVARVFTELADNLGVDIHLVDSLETGTGKQANGQYIKGNIYINVNSDFEQNMGYIFMHETTHHLKVFAPEQYKELENLVREKWFQYDASQMQSEIAKKIDLYARNGQKLTEDEALEEIIADATHEFLNDPNFAKEIADENPTLAKAILNSIRNVLRMLRQVLATGSIDDETHMNSLFTQLDIFDEAERLWLNAYQQAVANKAAVDIENLQNRIFEEGRGSIPATNTELANQESADIRHSISFNDKSFDELNDDEQRVIHEAVSPDIRFSMPTERDVLPKARYKSDIGFSNAISAISGKQARINALVKNGFSEKQAKQIGEAISNFILDTGNWIEGDLQSEFTFIGWDDLINAEVSVRKDWKGKVVGVSVSAMVANGEYPVNFDLTTICNKREGIMQVIQNLTRIKTDTGKSVLDSVKLTDQDMWNINKALKAEGIDTACLGCFVEARRYYTNRFIASIDNKWNTAVRETRRQLGLPEEEYFNFAHGKKVTGEDYTAISDLWTSYEKSKDTKKSPEQRIRILMNEIIKNKEVDSPYLKLVSASDILTPEGISGLKQISTGKHDLVKTLKSIYGTSAPKEILAFTPYNSEIALLPKNLKGQRTDKYLRSIGGIRIQSFSDFKIEHVIDHMQMVADMAARKFTCHAYSKVIAFPRIFGLTGQKINMSVMFDITPAEEWQTLLGCSEEKAKEYAFKYAGLRFVAEKPAENPDNRPYIETDIEGVHGYLTYLLGDADYINSVYEEEYQKNLAAGMDENEARRKANEAKPFEQSINYREAVELENQDGYKENVGIIAVAYGNEHLKILLADPNVRYVIPYHKSGLPVFVSEKTSLQYARNYEPVQNTKKADPKEKLQERFNAFKEKYKGEYPAIAFFGDIYENGGSIATTEATATEAAKLHGTGEFDVYKDLDKAKDIKEVANAYLEDCIENNLVPVFSEFAGDPNYYKMLFDFAVTDGTSDHIYPQKTVRNNYPGIDVDAKIAAGEKITEDDYAKLREAIRKGASEENVKNQTRSENMQNVLDDILSKDSENSILAGTNVNAIRDSATDYTNPKGIMYSITPEMDEAYMDAYWDGDDDAMQELVDEAANRAGYTYKAYHHTEFAFTVFDRSKARRSMDIQGFYFSADPEAEREYGSVRYDVFLKIENPYIVNSSESMKALPFDFGTDDAGVRAREWLQENGYDAVIRDAEYYGAEADEIIVFESSQIKSSEPMVFEDDPNAEYGEGDVIPLSQRFDPSNNDIRYSLPTQDSDGNILTDGQMEYFKNSQARDADGKMQVVYHTTDKGGFTIFDPSYSDDKRSLFFASNFAVSQTYGSGYQARERFDLKEITDEASLIDYLTNGHGLSFQVLTNEEFTEIGGDNATWGDINSNLGMPEYEYNVVNQKWASRKNEFKSASSLLIESYVEDLQNGAINPEDYVLLLKLPGQDSQFIKKFVAGKTLGALVERLNDSTKGNIQSKSGYYACYLNLENPLIVDAHGANWNRISYDPYGNEAAGITVQDAIEQIESADIADYGIKNIDVEFEYNDDGFPIAVSYDIGLLGIPDEEHWEWTNYVESDSFEPNVEEYTDNGVLDNAELSIAMWAWVEDKLRNYVSDGMIDMMEQTNIDVNGELHYESFNKTGYDFIRGGNIVDVSEFTDNIDDASGKEYTVNTRDLAEIAENYGHDGVIIRNLMDIGGASSLKGGQALSDIYIAFSSNQVKDTRNENPTENPDIRYSIVDDDSVMDLRQEEATSLDDMWFTDPELEEGRQRKQDARINFINKKDAVWNERWLTKGMLLDVKSVRTNIRKVVMAAMSESNLNVKYKNEIVDDFLVDAKKAFYLMKQDKHSDAAELLFNSAYNMLDKGRFFYEDESQRRYNELRDYLKTTKFTIPEDRWNDLAEGAGIQEYRKNNFGRIWLGRNGIDPTEAYGQLNEIWPEWFSEDMKGDQATIMDALAHALDALKPKAKALSSEYCIDWASDIADDLYSIVYEGKEYKSIADTYKEKYERRAKEMKTRNKEAVRQVREAVKAREEAKYAKKVEKLKARNKQNLRSQKLKYEDEIKTLKNNREYNIQRLKAEKERAVREERQRGKDKARERRNREIHKDLFAKIEKNHKILTDRLLTNTADKNIPEYFKHELSEMLASMDLQTMGSKEREVHTGPDGYVRVDVSQKTLRMAALQARLQQMHRETQQYFCVNDQIKDLILELSAKVDGKTIDALPYDQLKKISDLLDMLVHEFNTYKTVRDNEKRATVAEIGDNQINSALEHAEVFGEGRDYYNIPGAIDRILNMDEVTMAYMMRRIDPENKGLGKMYKNIRRSFDKYVKNTEQLNKWMDEIVGKYHKKGVLWNKYGSGQLAEWRSENYAQDFTLQNGKTITLTPAQMMSIHCLAKRAQARGHMLGAGIVVAPVSFEAKIISDLKKKASVALPVNLTEADLQMIDSRLTKDQLDVAEKLQELMATKMADWGNDASMRVLGIKLFNEKEYFPIRSDKAGLTKDLSDEQFSEAIRSFGFAKAVQPGARNAIMVEDIFDVVTEHCNNMNLYNSYSEAINDFMKVYNYRQYAEESEYTVEQAVAHAFSKKATTYIMTFIKDLNGNVSGRASGLTDMFNATLANAKKASVFANIRVFLQQPTALARAFAIISPKYAKNIRVSKAIMNEMFEHCPIALWKSWGYYDINMGKSIEDVIMNNGKWLEDVATSAYGMADNLTWTGIWSMVKAEVEDTHPGIEVGSDVYWELCNERMTEVVDFTQVVDSPMHRSHAMRSKDVFNKLMTSFMAEPTLTFNMIRDGLIRSSEQWKLGNKKEAGKIAGKTVTVAVAAAGATAAFAAVADVLRGKNPGADDDDDEERTLLEKWWANVLENFKDNANPLNNIYYIKELVSLHDGWQINNLALQGWKQLFDGYAQLTGSRDVRSSKKWYENMLSGIGYLTGIPIKTLMTDLGAATKLFGVHIPYLENTKARLDAMQQSGKKKESATPTVDSDSASGKLVDIFDSDKKKASSDKKAANVSAQSAQLAAFYEHYEQLSAKASEKAEGLTGQARNEKLWDVIGDGYTKSVDSANFATIYQMKEAFVNAGGDEDYFNAKIAEKCKTAYKKTLGNDISQDPGASLRQQRLKDFMLDHGISEAEISDLCYHSYTASDLKAAMRMGNEDYIMDELVPLVRAGLSREDYEKLWSNRNRGAKYYKGKYSDPKYKQSTGKYVWPINGQITSRFGHRSSPGGVGSTNHMGLDIAGSMGDPIGAADGGKVVFVGWYYGGGNTVMIQHDDGTITEYMHMSAFNCKEGDTVAQGQQIGQVGSTGNSTGPHCHFGVKTPDGNHVDPLQYLNEN